MEPIREAKWAGKEGVVKEVGSKRRTRSTIVIPVCISFLSSFEEPLDLCKGGHSCLMADMVICEKNWNNAIILKLCLIIP